MPIGRDPDECCDAWADRTSPLPKRPEPETYRIDVAASRNELTLCAAYETTPSAVRADLTAMLPRYGTRLALASTLGVSYSWLCDVMAGNRPIGPKLLSRLYPGKGR